MSEKSRNIKLFQVIYTFKSLSIKISILRQSVYKWHRKIWSYAKERLLKIHGVSKDNFIYYLKELEFRYNFRDNIDDSLYKCLGGIN
ncbi:MAG: hypothetical protein JHC31_07190 [Sulfurihydrogenibium sp.]|nr:hypothetical protein [Sulfurihydrogenibium sp.]